LAVLPGSLTLAGLTGDLTLTQASNTFGTGSISTLLLNPSPMGELVLAAGMDINGATIAMLDNTPGGTDTFPTVLPTTTLFQLEALHDPSIPHQNDPIPNRIYAGED